MESDVSDGQADLNPEGAISEASEATEGQSVVNQPTGNGADNVETFYDPKSIEGKPELQLLAKQLQGDYTKKLMAFSEGKTKIEAYDAFMADPQANLRQLATQYGLNLIEGAPTEFKPQTWDDVKEHLLAEARKEISREFAPLSNEVRDLKRQNVESQLDRDHPDWRTYEDKMKDNLQRHPTLVNDTDALYAMSVPNELLEQRSMSAALKKVKGGADSALVSDNRSTSTPTGDKPKGKLTFDEAVAFAKKTIGKQGLSKPVE